MKSQPITDRPDLTPVFGMLDPAERQRVEIELDRAQERLIGLRDALAGRSDRRWATTGVQLETLPSGQACITGCVESDELTFDVELRPCNFFDGGAWYPGEEPKKMADDAWDVEASVLVISDAAVDTGQQQVMELAGGRHRIAADACAALAEVTAQLQRGGSLTAPSSGSVALAA